MNTEELEFRRDLTRRMHPYWQLTWHEDGSVSPGVPDLSYVMHGDIYETGWLELKVSKSVRGNRWEVIIEPSQHQWFVRHVPRIPVHILIKHKDKWLIYHAGRSPFFNDTLSESDLISEASVVIETTPQYTKEDQLATVLRNFTFRR